MFEALTKPEFKLNQNDSFNDPTSRNSSQKNSVSNGNVVLANEENSNFSFNGNTEAKKTKEEAKASKDVSRYLADFNPKSEMFHENSMLLGETNS